MPTVSRPIPSTRGRRPVATSSRSPRSSVTAVERQDVLLAVSARGGGVLAEHQLDSVPAQRLAERLAERRRLAGKHPVGAFDDDRLAAETPHDLGQLDARRPTAQHQQAARDSLHARRLAGAPDAFELTQSRDRRHERSCAGRHHNVLRGMAGAVDVDHAGTGQLARAPQQVDAPVGQPALLAGVGPVRDHVVPPGQRGRRRRPARWLPPRARPPPPRPGAAATSTGYKPSRSTHRRPAPAPRRRRAARAEPAPRRSARQAPRRQERSRRSHCSSSSPTSVGCW